MTFLQLKFYHLRISCQFRLITALKVFKELFHNLTIFLRYSIVRKARSKVNVIFIEMQFLKHIIYRTFKRLIIYH